MYRVCLAFVSVHSLRVVTCWEGANLLDLVCDISLCFIAFLCGILGQVCCLIVSIPDVCLFSYINTSKKKRKDQELIQSSTRFVNRY